MTFVPHETSHETLAAAHQSDLFQALRPPVIAAGGAGRNSTAMLVNLIERGETVDVVLFAHTRSERPQTYRFIPIFPEWLDKHCGAHQTGSASAREDESAVVSCWVTKKPMATSSK